MDNPVLVAGHSYPQGSLSPIENHLLTVLPDGSELRKDQSRGFTVSFSNLSVAEVERLAEAVRRWL